MDQINRENVGELKGVWQVRLEGSGAGPRYSGEAQPIVHDGVIYMITGGANWAPSSYDVETGLYYSLCHGSDRHVPERSELQRRTRGRW